MARSSIEGLRIYQSAVSLEDQVFALVKTLPADQYYQLGNDLRRASAAVCHYISEAHKRYSYSLKLDSLHCARTEAEEATHLLEQFQADKHGDTTQLIEDYTGVIKQAWGLIKFFKNQQQIKQSATAPSQDEPAAPEAAEAKA
jgi:four helix bundle protein